MTSGTIEEKIYHRQIFKQFLVNRVLKDPKQRRFFKSNDLFELFTLTEATSESNTETSAIFAGTGANIKIKPKKIKSKYSVPVFQPKNDRGKEVDGAKKNVQNSLSRLYTEESDSIHSINDETKSSIMLSEELRLKLREKARKISNKLSKDTDAKVGENDAVKVRSKKKKSHKSHKKSKIKDKRFEGVKVSHLVKKRNYKAPLVNEEDEAKVAKNQDEYVLGKLFAKSGVHSALQHDAIVDDASPDFAIVESEAAEVAKQAVRAMKVGMKIETIQISSVLKIFEKFHLCLYQKCFLYLYQPSAMI